MEDSNNKEKDSLARSQSWAIIRHIERQGAIRKQSDPFVDDEPNSNGAPGDATVPIQHAQSYKPASSTADKTIEMAGVRRLMDTLNEHQPASSSSTQQQSRQSAASLKVHFRSVDDVSNDDDEESDGGIETSFDSRRRSQSAISWSVSGSDVTAQAADEDDDEDVADEEVNVAPDGGWGWVVVAASFVVNLIADGATFSFGVVYVELLQYFKESKGYTAWIGSLFMATPLLSGPLASSLTDRYGCRTVTIAGSIVAALGFILSSLSNSIEVMFLTFGLIAGLGLSLCYVAAIVIVAFYFDKRRSLATGLAVCGSGIGTFIFAPLTQHLIDEYGWRGATLIIAGLFLNMSVCGALMRDIEGTGSSRRGLGRRRISRSGSSETAAGFRSRNCSESDAEQRMMGNEYAADGHLTKVATEALPLHVDSDMFDSADTRLCNSLVTLPTFLLRGDKIPHEVLMTITNNPRLYSIVLDNYPALFDAYIVHDHKDTDGHHQQQQQHHHHHQATVTSTDTSSASKATKDPNCSPLKEAANNLLTVKEHQHPNAHHWNTAYLKGLKVKKTSLTYRGAMLNLPRYRLRASSCPDIYRNSITTIAREKEGACWDYLDELREALVFDFSYLSNPSFIMFAISNAMLYCCYHVPYIYLADWAIAQGHAEEDASFLLSIVGILNTVGVVLLGYIGDRPWANATWIYSISMFLCGLSTAVVPLLPENNYTWLAAASGLFGLSIGANYSLAAVILVDLISLERFVNAYGLLLLFQGVANLVGPPLAGWISDMTGSYDMSFYLAGIFIILSGAILGLLPAFKHVRSRMSATNVIIDSLENGTLATKANQLSKETYINSKESARLGQTKKTISSTPI